MPPAFCRDRDLRTLQSPSGTTSHEPYITTSDPPTARFVAYPGSLNTKWTACSLVYNSTILSACERLNSCELMYSASLSSKKTPFQFSCRIQCLRIYGKGDISYKQFIARGNICVLPQGTFLWHSAALSVAYAGRWPQANGATFLHHVCLHP